MDHKQLCLEVLAATKDNDQFSAEFIEKMLVRIEKNWGLSDKQAAAIEKIHAGWVKPDSPKPMVDVNAVKAAQDKMSEPVASDDIPF